MDSCDRNASLKPIALEQAPHKRETAIDSWSAMALHLRSSVKWPSISTRIAAQDLRGAVGSTLWTFLGGGLY